MSSWRSASFGPVPAGHEPLGSWLKAVCYAVMAFDHHRLAAEASSLLRAVRDSRARIQTAADDERRRIEHDLHDGAQQRLIALRIRLELAAEVIGEGPSANC